MALKPRHNLAFNGKALNQKDRPKEKPLILCIIRREYQQFKLPHRQLLKNNEEWISLLHLLYLRQNAGNRNTCLVHKSIKMNIKYNTFYYKNNEYFYKMKQMIKINVKTNSSIHFFYPALLVLNEWILDNT